MKAILKMLLYLVIGGVIGYLIVLPLIAVIEGESIVTVAKTVVGKFSLGTIAEILWMIVAGLAAFIINIEAMAVALVLDKDRPAAEKKHQDLQADRDKYIHQADVAMSLDLMLWLLDNRQTQA